MYFWWGDTVGYSCSGGMWNGSSYSDVTWVSSTGEQMGSSPFNSSTVPTYGKTVDQLRVLGYIDVNGNLTSEHDAANRHWGADWRMPTAADFWALLSYCDSQWTTLNGVSGRVFSGRGAFAKNSIFVPAAGVGNLSRLICPTLYGYYWSSAPYPDNSLFASYLDFASGDVYQNGNYRSRGFVVRPVRDFRK